MRLLALLALLLLPLSAFAQSADSLPGLSSGPLGTVTELHPSPGVTFLYDNHYRSATIYDQGNGLSWYSQQDAHGTVSQGYLYNPFPVEKPLTVPDFHQPPAPRGDPLPQGLYDGLR